MATGDRPNFPLTAQRLDKVDIEAISELVSENVMRTVGAILGPCAGLLSDVEVTYDTATTVATIGPCRLAYAAYEAGSTVATTGSVVRHDPAVVSGYETVSFTSLGLVDTPCYVFFQRSELPADEQNRAYFDALAQLKKVGVALTRQREYCQFTASTASFDVMALNDWYPFLYVTWGSPGVPTFNKIHAFDGYGTGINNALMFRSQNSLGLGVEDTQGHLGVARAIRHLLGSIQHAYDSDFQLSADGSVLTTIADLTYKWSGGGLPRGLKQLDADLATAEASLTEAGAAASTAVQPATLSAFVDAYLQTAPLYTMRTLIGTPTTANLGWVHAVSPVAAMALYYDPGKSSITFTELSKIDSNCVVNISVRGSSAGVSHVTHEWSSARVLQVYTWNGSTLTLDSRDFDLTVFAVTATGMTAADLPS